MLLLRETGYPHGPVREGVLRGPIRTQGDTRVGVQTLLDRQYILFGPRTEIAIFIHDFDEGLVCGVLERFVSAPLSNRRTPRGDR